MVSSSQGHSAACPSPERLEGFRTGCCEPPDASSISAHLSACGTCQQWLADAQANDAVLDGLLPVMDRAPRAAGNGSSSVRLADLVAPPSSSDLPASVRGFSI